MRKPVEARVVCAARHTFTPSVALETPEDYFAMLESMRCKEEVDNGRRCEQLFVAVGVRRGNQEQAAVSTLALAQAMFSGDQRRVDGATAESYMEEVRFFKEKPLEKK